MSVSVQGVDIIPDDLARVVDPIGVCTFNPNRIIERCIGVGGDSSLRVAKIGKLRPRAVNP